MSDAVAKILIVDDQSDTREFIKAVVSELGDFSIITGEDGEDGLQKAKAENPDLIILDVMMPKRDGFSVFNALRDDTAAGTDKIPVIMLTGVSKETGIKFSGEAMGEFFGKAPEEFIDKPIDPARLQDAVKAALGI